jgi:hypothetical protein
MNRRASDVSQLGLNMGSNNTDNKQESSDISHSISSLEVSNPKIAQLVSQESQKSLVSRFADYKDHPAIPAMPQSSIYDFIMDNVY